MRIVVVSILSLILCLALVQLVACVPRCVLLGVSLLILLLSLALDSCGLLGGFVFVVLDYVNYTSYDLLWNVKHFSYFQRACCTGYRDDE